MATSNTLHRIILITGEPGNKERSIILKLKIKFVKLPWFKGVGKTTIVKEIRDRLIKDGIKAIRGFYTEELRDSYHNRIGFDVVDINETNRRASLARTRYTTIKLFKYLKFIYFER